MPEVGEQPPAKETIQPRFEAVIACGMGPMELKASRDPHRNPVPTNVFNFFNAVASKISVAKGWAREGVLSGYPSSQTLKDFAQSEGGVLSHIYGQTRPKHTLKQAVDMAGSLKTIEDKATTTFGNILEGLNILDAKDARGHFDGIFGVVSCEFHGPRIAEMLKAFGLKNGRFVSAEGVLRAAGYSGGVRGFGPTYELFNTRAYPNQPAGLQNIEDSPSYVTRDLAVIASPRRFYEVATALKSYYTDRAEPVALPGCYTKLPATFDPAFDFASLKAECAAVAFTKHPFTGDPAEGLQSYRASARELTDQTVRHLMYL